MREIRDDCNEEAAPEAQDLIAQLKHLVALGDGDEKHVLLNAVDWDPYAASQEQLDATGCTRDDLIKFVEDYMLEAQAGAQNARRQFPEEHGGRADARRRRSAPATRPPHRPVRQNAAMVKSVPTSECPG